MPIDRNIKTISKREVPLILVTNDDGVASKGINMLSASLGKVGRVVIVAPEREQSAGSHALTLHQPLRVRELDKDIYAVDGTPTDCVNLGVNGILKERPDIIVSGINHGGNMGEDVNYSGTVSAALEGGIMGVPSIAVSLAARKDFRFEPAADFAEKLVRKILDPEFLQKGLLQGVILNVNVPNLPEEKIKGYKFTSQGRWCYNDIIVEKLDPRGKKYYWIAGCDPGFEDIPDTDCKVVAEGRISITPLRVDATDAGFLEITRSWEIY